MVVVSVACGTSANGPDPSPDPIGFTFQTADGSLSSIGWTGVFHNIKGDPGAAFGKHSHPGEEIAYVIEGVLEYQIEGKPPITLGPGEVLFIPAGTIHAAKNAGSVNGAELATYIVEKGKPLVVMLNEP